MRISDLMVVVALAGLASACDNAGVTNGTASGAWREVPELLGRNEATAPPPRFACRVKGMTQWADACTVRVARQGQGKATLLTLIGPDGGFRRMIVDGKDLREADGAEPLGITVSTEHAVELTIGGNAYRVPLSVLRAQP